MSLLTKNIKQVFTKSIDSFKRFPLAMASSVFATAIMLYFMQFHIKDFSGANLVLLKLVLVFSLGFFIFTALKLLRYSFDSKVYKIIFGLAVASLISYYFFLPDINRWHSANLQKHFFLIITSFLAILWTPFLTHSTSNKEYWEYAKRIIFASFITAVFTIILILGVNIAIFSIDALFDFRISGEHIGMINLFIVGTFSSSYFLSQIPKNPLSSLELKNSKIEKFFTKYILTPLSIVYFAILYTYTVKVLISMDWPRGILAWLIVAFSFVAILTYLFWTPFVSKEKSRWQKVVWLGILLQTGMLFSAIIMRIEAYSWTINRYMVFIFGVWLAGVSIYFLLFKNAKIKWLFISLSTILLFSQIGPQSAYNISKQAQTKRLQKAVKTYKNLKSTKQEVPLKLKYNISSITEYLYNHFGLKSLKNIYPNIVAEFKSLKEKEKKIRKELEKKDLEFEWEVLNKRLDELYGGRPQRFPNFATNELGFRFVYQWDYKNQELKEKEPTFYQYAIIKSKKQILAEDIQEFNYLVRLDYISDSPKKIYIKNLDTYIFVKDGVLKIKRKDEEVVFELFELVKNLSKKYDTIKEDLKPSELTLQKNTKSLKVRVEFDNIRVFISKKRKNIFLNAILLFEVKHDK